jgi:hypothetical protein
MNRRPTPHSVRRISAGLALAFLVSGGIGPVRAAEPIVAAVTTSIPLDGAVYSSTARVAPDAALIFVSGTSAPDAAGAVGELTQRLAPTLSKCSLLRVLSVGSTFASDASSVSRCCSNASTSATDAASSVFIASASTAAVCSAVIFCGWTTPRMTRAIATIQTDAMNTCFISQLTLVAPTAASWLSSNGGRAAACSLYSSLRAKRFTTRTTPMIAFLDFACVNVELDLPPERKSS